MNQEEHPGADRIPQYWNESNENFPQKAKVLDYVPCKT